MSQAIRTKIVHDAGLACVMLLSTYTLYAQMYDMCLKLLMDSLDYRTIYFQPCPLNPRPSDQQFDALPTELIR